MLAFTTAFALGLVNTPFPASRMVRIEERLNETVATLAVVVQELSEVRAEVAASRPLPPGAPPTMPPPPPPQGPRPPCDAAVVLALGPRQGAEDETQLQHYHSSFWASEATTGYEPEMISCGYALSDAKTELWAGTRLGQHFTIVAHYQPDGTELGRAVYPVRAAYQDCSLYQLFNGLCAGETTDIQFTDDKDAGLSSGTIVNQPSGAIAALEANDQNTAVSQTYNNVMRGDLFIDNSEALVVNKFETNGNSYNGAQRSNVRLTTTLSTQTVWSNAHSFGGIGGRHEHGINDWVIDYESAPMTQYCSANTQNYYAVAPLDQGPDYSTDGISTGNARIGYRINDAGNGVTLATFEGAFGNNFPLGRGCYQGGNTQGAHAVMYSLHVSGTAL